MLRINLLPAYIAEQKKTRATWWWAGSLLVVCVAGPLLARFAYQDPLYNSTLEAATAADLAAKKVEDTRQLASAEKAKVDPIQKKVDFVKDVQFFNGFPGLIYRNVAKYTYSAAEYSSMAVQGDSLTINAFVPKLEDYGRFYLTLFGNPDIKELSVKGLPDWVQLEQMNQMPPDARRGFPVQVTARLQHPLVPPVSPLGQSGGGAGGGFPGGGGAPPMMGGMPGGGSMPGAASMGGGGPMMGKGG